ncbi:MAG: GDSL-type esterase/lipase family protein [Planctomycetota bacterium]|jgi:lysophospholipase L1-like esterase|nr:GDSL-type esterase/lipase family protein [Planctomycetota bacterium]
MSRLILALFVFGVVVGASAEERNTKDGSWCTMSAPVTVSPGDAFEVKISVKADAIPAATKLWVGLHPFINGARKPTGAYNRPGQALAAGAAGEHTFSFKTPGKDGLQALAVVVWVSPTGGWGDKTKSGGMGIKVVAKQAGAEADKPASEAGAAKADKPAKPEQAANTPAPANPPAKGALPAERLQARGGLPNLAAKLAKGEDIDVVFIGGSITVQGGAKTGYVTAVNEWLQKTYPKSVIRVHNRGVSGTNSDFGAKRFERDVLSENPDLVLIEFSVNDLKRDMKRSMERMVQKAWRHDPSIDIVIFYTLHKDQLPSYAAGTLPKSASSHETVAIHYNVPTIAPAQVAAAQINAGTLAWDAFGKDACHPTAQGQALFGEVLVTGLTELLTVGTPGEHALPDLITGMSFDNPGPELKPLTDKPGVYSLPVPNVNWGYDPAFKSTDGAVVWRASWMPRNKGGRLDASVGADAKLWLERDMTWVTDMRGFSGPHGMALFRPYGSGVGLGAAHNEIGVVRFVAPKAGAYVVNMSSSKLPKHPMALNVLHRVAGADTAASIALVRSDKQADKKLTSSTSVNLAAGDEVVIVADTRAPPYLGSLWPNLSVEITAQ